MGIKQQVLKGTFYIAVAKYSGLVVGLIITSILARILTPEDYGVVAIAMAFITFFTLLSDMGIGSAIVQYKDLSKKEVSSIFGLTFWLGIILALSFFFSSYLIASFFNNQQLVLICQILSIQVLFIAFNMVPNALLLKEQKFKIIAFRTLFVQILCGILAVVVACHNGGVYSLLIAPVGGSFLTFIINAFCSGLQYSLLLQKKVIKKIASFSIFQFLFGVVNYFGNNLHAMIIGKVIGMNALGYYEKGDRLIAMPMQNINGVLAPVLHPVLSNYQDNHDFIFHALQKITNILCVISIPISVFFFIAAKDIVLILFGNQWLNAVSCIQILSFTIIFRMTSISLGAILQTLNRTNLLFKLGLVNVSIAILALCISILISNTIESICSGAVCSAAFSFVSTFYALFHIAFKKSFFKEMIMFFKPFVFYFLSLFIGIAFMDYLNYNLLINLFVKVSVVGILALGYFHFFTDYKMSKIFKIK